MTIFKRVGSILSGCIFVLGIFWIFFSEITFQSQGRYTIGITDGMDFSGGGPFIKYKFEFQGVEYKRKNRKLKYDPEVEGGRYFVKVLPTDASKSRIYWGKPVPYGIIEAPSAGWVDLPD